MLISSRLENFKRELLERYEPRMEQCDIVKDAVPESCTGRDVCVLDKVLHRVNDLPRYMEKIKQVCNEAFSINTHK